ncbi:MAG: caspase family protein [Planctomycetota bacterium]
MNSEPPHLVSLALTALLAVSLLVSCGESSQQQAQETSAAKGGDSGLAAGGDLQPDEAPGRASEASRSGPQLPLRALLIGVGDYPADADGAVAVVPDLRGPVRDVEAMRDLLLERFRVDPEGIRTLLDAEATVGGIVRAIDEHLLQKAEAGDEVLVYFSGHGSRVRDVSGRERGGMDSSLVAYDSRFGRRDGEFDITDDVVYSLLRPMVEKGAHVVVLTDSCHSGGVVRGEVRVRAVSAGEAAVGDVEAWPFWPKGVPFVDDDQRDGQAEMQGYVHLAACTPEQRAYELPFKSGWHGAFTWALLDVMRALDAGLSWADVASRAAARVNRLPIPPQTLWVDGADRQREVFGSRFVPIPDRFVVKDLGWGRGLSLSAGTLHGLEVGAKLTATDESGEWFAPVEVVEVELATSRAVWGREGVEPPVGKAIYASLGSVGAVRAPLRVHVGDGDLRAALEGSDWVVLAESPDSPYVVETGAEDRVVFRTQEGIPIWRQPLGEGGEQALLVDLLRGAFVREARFQALWQLADPSQRGEFSNLVVELAAPSELRDGEGAVELVPTPGAATGSFDLALPSYEAIDSSAVPSPTGVLRVRSEDLVGRKAVGSRKSSDLFLHVLSLNEAREVVPIYQDPDRPITQFQVEQMISRDLRLSMGAMPADVFPLERPMLERILVIVCRSPLDLDALESRVETSTRSVAAGLPAVLEGGFGGRKLRSGGSAARDASGWGLAWIDLFIHRLPD